MTQEEFKKQVLKILEDCDSWDDYAISYHEDGCVYLKSYIANRIANLAMEIKK